jgi:hypothetical protein
MLALLTRRIEDFRLNNLKWNVDLVPNTMYLIKLA